MHAQLSFFPSSSSCQTAPSSMGKEDAEKEGRETPAPKNRSSVIVTVYVESSTANHRSHRKSSSRNRQKHCSSKPPISTRHGSGGTDRKAQLLAYAQQLRSSHSKEISWLKTNLRPKRKKKYSWRHCKEKFRLCFQRIFRPARSRQRSEPPSGNKSNAAGRNCSKHFLRRLRSMLKELSCGWKCHKG